MARKALQMVQLHPAASSNAMMFVAMGIINRNGGGDYREPRPLLVITPSGGSNCGRRGNRSANTATCAPWCVCRGGDNGTTCEGCRLEITSSQQWDGPPVVEPACQNRRGPRFRLLESDGTMRSRFWAAPSSARGEICTRACLCARLAAAQTSITINIHGDMWKILKRIKQQRPRRTHQTTFFLAPTDGELRLSRGGETSHGRPRFPTTHESGIVCLLGARAEHQKSPITV